MEITKKGDKTKDKKQGSNLLGLLSGLNPHWRCYARFYFFHYFV